MSSTAFYRGALARDLSPRARTLMESLLSRSEQIEALAEALPAQILANRSRREGKPVTLKKSAQRTIKSFANDSREAAASLPALVARLPSESDVIRVALQCERQDLSMDQLVYSGGHPEDGALARPVLELRAENIAELETFLSATTPPKTGPGRGG